LYSALKFNSISVERQVGSAEADGVFGAAYVSLASPLTAYLTYYSVAANWTAGTDPTTASVDGAASLIGSSYHSLLEIDANNNTIQRIVLDTLTWSLSGVTTVGNLKYATFTGTDSAVSNFLINITFVGSSVIGVLNNGAVVTPKSVEASINILNFPFTSATSNLRLVAVVATCSGTAAGQLTRTGDWHRVAAGTGSGAVYFETAASATVDNQGNTKSVNISAEVFTSVTADLSAVVNQVQTLSKAGKACSWQVLNITFPQSSNITYDPVIAASETVNTGTSAGSALVAQSSLVLACLFVALVLGNFQ